MAIEYLPSQAVPFYKLAPTDAEISNGATAWALTAYHKRLGNCGFIGLDYCNPVLNTDKLNFQFKANYDADIFQPIYEDQISTGSATSTSANHLIDAAADFVTEGVQNGYLVINSTTMTSARVTNVTATDLTLNANIFTSGNNYYIIPVQTSGNFTYNPTTEVFTVSTAGSSSIETTGLTVGNWYRVVINVTDITAGALTIALGGNTFATINSVGTHVVYGECTVSTAFQIAANASFLGSFSATSVNVNQLFQDYTIGVFDLDDVYQNSIAVNYDGDGLTIGNIIIELEWGNFSLPCGSYVLAVYDGDVEQCAGNMVTNGNLAGGSTGWSLDPSISISGGKLNVNAASPGDSFSNNLQCCLVAGRSYTLTFDVSSLSGIKVGSYIIENDPVGSSQNAALQTSVSYTFTPDLDSCVLGFQLNGLTNQFSMDNFVLVCNDCELDINDADGASECFCVCDNHDCTVLLKYRNTRNSFGNYYLDDTYYNYLRLPASVQTANITDKELIQFKNSLHLMNIPYWNGIKVAELATNLLPNWVHEAIATALKHRILYIDGVQYVGIAEHSPIIEKTEVFGAVTKIAQVNQKHLNSNW